MANKPKSILCDMVESCLFWHYRGWIQVPVLMSVTLDKSPDLTASSSSRCELELTEAALPSWQSSSANQTCVRALGKLGQLRSVRRSVTHCYLASKSKPPLCSWPICIAAAGVVGTSLLQFLSGYDGNMQALLPLSSGPEAMAIPCKFPSIRSAGGQPAENGSKGNSAAGKFASLTGLSGWKLFLVFQATLPSV